MDTMTNVACAGLIGIVGSICTVFCAIEAVGDAVGAGLLMETDSIVGESEFIGI